MRLSVLIPVYNERRTIESIILRVLQLDKVSEVVAVDDGSTDGTRDVLDKVLTKFPETLRCAFHSSNLGKGAAIRTALAEATGDIIAIQDADLEYHPEDYPAALKLIEQGYADAVYGSRFLGPHRVFMYWHFLGNRVLTTLCNLLTGGILSDMETGFKVIRADVLKNLDIQSYSFDFEVEVTVKLFRHGYRVYEIPITYTGRTYSEGKKITWRDGVSAFWALLKWGILVRRRSIR
ncbi:glycosyltransferase family 2 protein [Petrachloros mirabilis]